MNPTDTRDDLDFDSRESLESEMTWYIPRQARNGYSEFNGVVDHPPLGRGKAEQSETRETRVRRLASDDCARGLVWSFNPSNRSFNPPEGVVVVVVVPVVLVVVVVNKQLL